MRSHRIELQGRGVSGTVVNARVLRTVLGVLIEGSQQAVRLKTQGRSKARGTLPRWIDAATEFRVRIAEGSTVLEIQAPSLLEADPEEFSQRQLFPEVDPQCSSFDYFVEAADAAMGGEERSDLYDRGLLATLRQLDAVFDHGVDSIGLRTSTNGRSGSIRITPPALADFTRLEARIPHPQQVRIAGRLDSIRHSDHTFTLLVPGHLERIKGVALEEHVPALQQMWGKAVLASGRAHFTASGQVQRIDADLIHSASDRDLKMWPVPEPVRQPSPRAAFRLEQGARSGLAAILGQWPGDESDEEIQAALEELS